jgi:hypothetical protein
MALRGRPIPDGKKRDQVITIGSSSVPKTTNPSGLSSFGSSREDKAIFNGRASTSMAELTKGYRRDDDEGKKPYITSLPLPFHLSFP